jgi:hypothetical protein
MLLEMHAAEPLVPESISSEVEIDTEELGTDQMLVELIKA